MTSTQTQPVKATAAQPPGQLPPWTGYLIGPVFLLLAGWFAWGPEGLDIPEYHEASFDRSLLTTTPRRKILTDPPTIVIDGFKRTCMDCHRMFPPRSDTPVRLMQHKHIVLRHGINDRCRNCHYEKDRNKLVLYGGQVIGYAQVVTLCAKCHGPRYREWQYGAHGRTNGYWDATRGRRHRLGCTECHNPHNPRVPAMDALQPLPGPNTLRMRPPRRGEHVEPAPLHDPLRRDVDDERLLIHRSGARAPDPAAYDGPDDER